MAAAEEKLKGGGASGKVADESCYGASTVEKISSRKTKDLVIGFCGLVGSGVKAVTEAVEERLIEFGYEVVKVRVSELMKKHFPEGKALPKDLSPFDRYDKLQDLGDSLRLRYGASVLAECAIREIKIDKKVRDGIRKRQGVKTAYLIDQLKNPAEVEVFRTVYQHNFYHIGVFRDEKERKRNLRDERISERDIDTLIHNDKKSSDDFGQQTQKTILDSDFFIKNNQGHKKNLSDKVGRFLRLVHGVNGLTPTQHEKGMYAAFTASLQSACLSRQVGASIFDSQGNQIATGKNDVPKAGGGLYSADDGDQDHRCIHKGGKCYNDFRKKRIRDDIREIVDGRVAKGVSVDDLVDEICKKSPISSLIEYSRSIHAEMDAIVSLSRSSSLTSKGSVIYTTTFPCHNCARHIVAAGIERAVYIEPYDKSLVLDLHDDAVSKDYGEGKVVFEAFEGISPRRYQKFFFPLTDRKDSDGMAVKYTVPDENHIDAQFLDSYETYETKVAMIFEGKLGLQDEGAD